MAGLRQACSAIRTGRSRMVLLAPNTRGGDGGGGVYTSTSAGAGAGAGVVVHGGLDSLQ